jgi:hypothetical protein
MARLWYFILRNGGEWKISFGVNLYGPYDEQRWAHAVSQDRRLSEMNLAGAALADFDITTLDSWTLG